MLIDACLNVDRLTLNTGIYESIHFPLLAQQSDPDVPRPRNICQLPLGDPEAIPGQLKDVIPPAGPVWRPKTRLQT